MANIEIPTGNGYAVTLKDQGREIQFKAPVLALPGGARRLDQLTVLIEKSPEVKADLARENQRLEALR